MITTENDKIFVFLGIGKLKTTKNLFYSENVPEKSNQCLRKRNTLSVKVTEIG